MATRRRNLRFALNDDPRPDPAGRSQEDLLLFPSRDDFTSFDVQGPTQGSRRLQPRLARAARIQQVRDAFSLRRDTSTGLLPGRGFSLQPLGFNLRLSEEAIGAGELEQEIAEFAGRSFVTLPTTEADPGLSPLRTRRSASGTLLTQAAPPAAPEPNRLSSLGIRRQTLRTNRDVVEARIGRRPVGRRRTGDNL